MKLLHTADWHLGKRLDHFSRLAEQHAVLAEICVIAEAENVDAVLIAGDIFDAFNPPVEAQELFYNTVRRLSDEGRRAIVAIAGNHDSPALLEAPVALAREHGIVLAGYPDTTVPPFRHRSGLEVLQSAPGFVELKLATQASPLRLLLTPYASQDRLRKFLNGQDMEMRTLLAAHWKELAERYCDAVGVNILLSHLLMFRRGEAEPEEPEDERPIANVGGAEVVYTDLIPEAIQYTALGHLHRKQCMATEPCPVYYSSSPLSYSMSEANQQKYVLILEAEPGQQVQVRERELREGRPLLRAKFHDIAAALEWLGQHPAALVELMLVSDTYITAEDRRRLSRAHQGIVSIIPEIHDPGNEQSSMRANIDLSKSELELFRDYFYYKHGQEPGEDIITVFREILAAEGGKG